MVTAFVVLLLIALAITALYVHDIRQTQHTILRNFPVLGHFRYFSESFGEYMRQYQYLPDWLERRQGRFLATVSAAGLLTMLGSAPYSVTKHGALAFAEWMSITYRDRGIITQALCPQGVRTDMLDASGPQGKAILESSAISVEEVADAVVEGLQGDKFLILPHPEVATYYAHRGTDPDRWAAQMAKLQSSVWGAAGA